MTRFTTRASICAALLALAGAARADDAAPAIPREALADAWWTGPLLAPNASSFPAGHALIEPYAFDVINKGQYDRSGHHEPATGGHEVGSLTYLIYALTDRVSVGVLPRFAYDSPAGAPGSSAPGIGDFGAQVQFGLTSFREGSWVPSTAVVVAETFPTGRYDRLTNTADGFGAGVYTTAFSWYSQDYLWMPNGRILRVRLDLTYAISSAASVVGQSVYGTPAGFSGHAYPGDSFTADAASEYSMTRNWVLATDLVWVHNSSTRVAGGEPAAGVPALPDTATGSSEYLAVAPAVEYNFTGAVGVIVGARVFVAGRNTGASVTPVAAINLVF
ncbi:MAG: transporter [Gammaproteobacteria bacterium]|nr:transporter [Gammaproteobacteria bacterium]